MPVLFALDPSGHATLFDLGMALPIGNAIGPEFRELRGTLAYTAPELFTSCQAAEPASDVYSLGVVLYEMLAGRRPFECTQPAKYVEAHRCAIASRA